MFFFYHLVHHNGNCTLLWGDLSKPPGTMAKCWPQPLKTARINKSFHLRTAIASCHSQDPESDRSGYRATVKCHVLQRLSFYYGPWGSNTVGLSVECVLTQVSVVTRRIGETLISRSALYGSTDMPLWVYVVLGKELGLDVGGWRGVMAAGSHLISQTNSPEEGLFKFGCVLQPELSPDGGWEAERCSLALLIVGFNFTWHHEGFSAPEPVRGKRTPLVSLLYLWHEVRECASAYFIKTVLFTAGAIVLPPVKPVGPLWKRLMDKYFMSLFLKKTTFFSNF